MNDPIKLFTIPNLLTCCNLLCGCMGLLQVLQNGNLAIASWCIVAAAVFDFLDGFVARLLKQSSPIGKELDSLADVVTFGVLPGAILFGLIRENSAEAFYFSYNKMRFLWPYMAYVAFGLIAIFSALRLAKFNIDTRQSDSFIGVPTPANAILVASLPLIQRYQPEIGSYFTNSYLLFGYSVMMSYLLVSEIPLMAFKFKTFAWADNQIRYIFLIVSVILLFLLKFAAVPLIVGLYVLVSLFTKNKK